MAGLPNMPLINGFRFEWSSVELAVDGSQKYVGVKGLDYTSSLKGNKVYGTSALPIGRTRGQYDATGKLSLYKEESGDFIAYLATKNPSTGIFEAVFDITVNYSEKIAGQVQTDKLIGCRITSRNDSHAQGGDGLSVDYELDIMSVMYGTNAGSTLVPAVFGQTANLFGLGK